MQLLEQMADRETKFQSTNTEDISSQALPEEVRLNINGLEKTMDPGQSNRDSFLGNTKMSARNNTKMSARNNTKMSARNTFIAGTPLRNTVIMKPKNPSYDRYNEMNMAESVMSPRINMQSILVKSLPLSDHNSEKNFVFTAHEASRV